MTNSILYIRADGNASIGTGHVMRCLSVAARLKKTSGQRCVFITADHEMVNLFESHCVEYICLDSQWDDLDKETNKLTRLIKTEKIDCLLVDSYFVTKSYLSALCACTYVIYIDDLDAFTYPCHALINYNFYAFKHNYPERYPDCKLYLGPKYAPLREEFWDLPSKEISPDIRSVMVTTGGSDRLGVAEKITRILKLAPTTSHILVHAVVGRFADAAPISALAKKYPGIIIHQNITSMSKLMCSCDVAISAAGSTIYELCACGIPTILYSLADNQLEIASTFAELGGIYIGDVRNKTGQVLDCLPAALTQFTASNRQELSALMQGLLIGEKSL